MEYPFELFKHGESKEDQELRRGSRARAQGFTEPYKYQEYPKHLYKDGARGARVDSGEQLHAAAERVVKSKDEEDARAPTATGCCTSRAGAGREEGRPKARRTTRAAKTAPRARPRARTASNALCRPPTT
jgi:hypothetical protein